MRTQAICLALVIVLLCHFASAQWVKLPISIYATSVATVGTRSICEVHPPLALFRSSMLLRSRDNGNHWDTLAILASSAYPRHPIWVWGRLIAVDTILVTELVYETDVSSDCFIVRSTDGGRNWIDTAHVPEDLGQFLRVGSRLYSFSWAGSERTRQIRSSTNMWDDLGHCETIGSPQRFVWPCGEQRNSLFLQHVG